jgi:hypothetical protein
MYGGKIFCTSESCATKSVEPKRQNDRYEQDNTATRKKKFSGHSHTTTHTTRGLNASVSIRDTDNNSGIVKKTWQLTNEHAKNALLTVA